LANKSYDQEKDGLGLFRVEKNDLDEKLRTLLAEFRAGSPQSRSQLTFRLSMADLYTMIHFSKRSAVFALREKSSERCAEGLTALAAVDIDRVDTRDLHWGAALVDIAATSIGADRDQLYAAATALAAAATRGALASFHARNREGASLDDWGYRIADTPFGPSLVQADFGPYSPSADLLGLAVRASEVVEAPRYPRADFTVATSIPSVWIGSKDARVKTVLSQSAGTVRMALSGATQPVIGGQLFHVYFSELASERDAAWLASAAPRDESDKSTTIAFSAGRLVCVAVTAATTSGVPSTESSDSLRTALEPVRSLLSQGL
jgi:hypothetical protein